jgi:hypothetical protein
MYFYVTVGRWQFVVTVGKRWAFLHDQDLTDE